MTYDVIIFLFAGFCWKLIPFLRCFSGRCNKVHKKLIVSSCLKILFDLSVYSNGKYNVIFQQITAILFDFSHGCSSGLTFASLREQVQVLDKTDIFFVILITLGNYTFMNYCFHAIDRLNLNKVISTILCILYCPVVTFL